MNGTGKSFDIQGNDVMKCFDEMWYEETLNDLSDVKIQDENFALISKLDEKCQIVVKTPCGVTDMFKMERIILQGSVFGPIKCSVQMDTLGRESLRTGSGIFKYKQTVDVPSLAMIDDILGLSSCGDESIELNALVNAKMENKKLRLSEDKCFKIHICKKDEQCTQVLRVHDNKMKNVSQATYLGDVLSDTGSIDETISQRCQKALGISTQINSMLSSICLGRFHFDIVMVLRDAKLVNSILTNSESWHNVLVRHIKSLEKMDLDLLRKIFNAHSKTPSEAFFLELGKYPLRFVLAKRRLMYLWHILNRDTDELIWKVYQTQKLKCSRGDWYEIIMEERQKYDILESDEEIATMSRDKFHTKVEKSIKMCAVKYLTIFTEGHSKTIEIRKQTFERKAYMSDRRYSKEDVQLLFSLRTKMADCKTNFSHQYGDDLACRTCRDADTLENEDHLLVCPALNDEAHDVTFNDVYGNIDVQYEVTQIFKKILRKQKIYLDTAQQTSQTFHQL